MSEEKEKKPDATVIESTSEAKDKHIPPEEASQVTESESVEADPKETPVVNTNVQKEIDHSNAEDAEDSENYRRHHIPMLDYHSMSMENLVGELQRLVKNEKIQSIKRHIDSIKHEFDHKFQEYVEQKKEEFVSKGGNAADFKFSSVAKRNFNDLFREYREKRQAYYKNLEKNLKDNLENRLTIIEELKGLVSMEEDINTTYKNFKELQERWKHAGSVPRNNYNDVWRTYHHHVEIFYDFLHLNRELRDLDFKHNLEEKEKLIAQAEALAEDADVSKAFRKLQTLHKIWKEDIGPVAKEHREPIWERFSAATKAMHLRRQEFLKDVEKHYEKNLENKKEIITKIQEISSHVATNHRGLQEQIKKVEALREAFFKSGKVPQKKSDEVWGNFKEVVRTFNRNKNAFYKNLKKLQQENLEKKRALLAKAESLKDSEDWETTTPIMKEIQRDWKKIGHVPRKFSDKIWEEFKKACNHYFDRLHESKNASLKVEHENYEKKVAVLKRLKDYTLSGDKKKDLEGIAAWVEEWKGLGRVPFAKKNINSKFNKIIEALYKKSGVSIQETELLKYGNKIQQLAHADNEYAIAHERTFIRRKIQEANSELRQLENNMEFFSNTSGDNPLLKEVMQNIDRHKKALATWKAKLKKLNIMEHQLKKEGDVENSSEEE
ncbi:MAG: DUF349 domain-containing protein [Bacteroidia bacterium]|nr:DUF349 domain-containing protein [Bacteroidia bacterium]